MNPEPEPLVDAKELAKTIPLPPSYFLRLARNGAVPHYRIGKRVLFLRSEVIAAFKHVPEEPR